MYILSPNYIVNFVVTQLFLTDVVVVLSAREVVPLYTGVSETVERHTVLWTPVRLRGVPVGERERVPRLDPEKSAFCLKIRTPDPIVHVVIGMVTMEKGDSILQESILHRRFNFN